MKTLSLFPAVAAASFMAAPAFAQQASNPDPAPSVNSDDSTTTGQEDDFHKDEGIVVTAPYVQRLDILSGTSSLAGEDLAAQTKGQIGDMLTKLPGVSASSFSPGASRPILRGFQGNRVAVLTDGIGNIDASNTSADHAVTIDSLTSERIEVLRGPAVLLFGGQAVGGAVNIIDKRIPRKIPDEPIHVDALLGYSTAANEYSGGASIDVPISSKFAAHVDGSYRKSDDLDIGGYLLSPELRAEALTFAADQARLGNATAASNARDWAAYRGPLPNSGVETFSLGAGGSYIDDGGNLGVSFNLYDTKYGIPDRPDFANPVGGQVSIDLRQYRFDLRGELELGEGLFDKLRVRAGYANYTHSELDGSTVGTTFFSKAIESRLELTQNDRGGWRGASGLQYQTRDFKAVGDEAFIPPTLSSQLGLFTLQEIDLGSLEGEVALRYDKADVRAQTLGLSRNFDNISAAIGLAYKTGDLKIGTNISRTGRAPSVEELFSDGPHVATQSYEVGDPNLRSEKSWNGEIYARLDGNRFNASATLYTNRFDGFIYESATGAIVDGLPEFVYLQRKASVWGIEAQADAKLAQLGNFDISVDGVADLTRATINGTGPAPRIPPLRLLGGLALKSDALDLRGEVEWTDSQTRIASFETPTKGFTMVNAEATWRPFGKDQNISLIASAHNIFDVEARRAASFTKDFVALAGRDFRLTARFSF